MFYVLLRVTKTGTYHEEKLTEEVDCRIIVSPPAFGAFDLGIGRTLNE
jgi:hypothetical protein